MLESPDECWDETCPTGEGNLQLVKKNKLDCLKNNAKSVCSCCAKNGLPDCLVAVPNVGLVDTCNGKWVESYHNLSNYNNSCIVKENFISLSGAVRRPFSPSYYDPNYKKPYLSGVS